MKKMMFNDRCELTQAVIEGRKTVTRRVIDNNLTQFHAINDDGSIELVGYKRVYRFMPKYKVGEIVAVAQSYKNAGYAEDKIFYRYIKEHDGYLQGLAINDKGWANKMYVCADLMPHQVRILDVRAERLQDITDEDCLREGIRYLDDIDCYYFGETKYNEGFYLNTPRKAFSALIDEIGGKGTWDSNPWVWRIEFKLVG